MFNRKKPFYFVDYGQGKFWTLFSSGGFHNVLSLSKESFVRLDWYKDDLQVVGEAAHLEIPQDRSLAQPLTYDEITTLEQSIVARGGSLYVASQHLCPKARGLCSDKLIDKAKDRDADKWDCVAWVEFLQKSKYTPGALRRHDNQMLESIQEFRQVTNDRLNWARTMETDKIERYKIRPGTIVSRYGRVYEIKGDHCQRLIKGAGLLGTIAPPGYSEQVKLASVGTEKQGLRYKQAYSLAAMLVDPWTGDVRIAKHTGKRPGINWLMRHIAGNTDRHRKGGVARSNIQWFGSRSALGVKSGPKWKRWREMTQTELDDLHSQRKQYRHRQRTALQLMRDVQDGKIQCETYAELSHATSLEVLRASVIQESLF